MPSPHILVFVASITVGIVLKMLLIITVFSGNMPKILDSVAKL